MFQRWTRYFGHACALDYSAASCAACIIDVRTKRCSNVGTHASAQRRSDRATNVGTASAFTYSISGVRSNAPAARRRPIWGVVL